MFYYVEILANSVNEILSPNFKVPRKKIRKNIEIVRIALELLFFFQTES